MEIDELINILNQAKRDELKHVKILRRAEYEYSSEFVSGFSYDFLDDSIILFPDYL